MKTLKKNYEFQNVLSKGKFYLGKQVTIYIIKNREDINKIGIAVSAKAYNAVERNSIKRIIRENYRLIKNDLNQGYNIVFVWNKKIPVKKLDFHIISQDMYDIFSKAGMVK